MWVRIYLAINQQEHFWKFTKKKKRGYFRQAFKIRSDWNSLFLGSLEKCQTTNWRPL